VQRSTAWALFRKRRRWARREKGSPPGLRERFHSPMRHSTVLILIRCVASDLQYARGRDARAFLVSRPSKRGWLEKPFRRNHNPGLCDECRKRRSRWFVVVTSHQGPAKTVVEGK
jgi:hypothetical protein